MLESLYSLITLSPWYQRKRREDVSKFVAGELIKRRDTGLETRCGDSVASTRQSARERHDFARRLRRMVTSWHGQLFDQPSRDVRRHSQPNEIIDVEAIEQAAQVVLTAGR